MGLIYLAPGGVKTPTPAPPSTPQPVQPPNVSPPPPITPHSITSDISPSNNKLPTKVDVKEVPPEVMKPPSQQYVFLPASDLRDLEWYKMQSSAYISCGWTSLLFLMAERFLGHVELGLNMNTMERFILAWVSCWLANNITPYVLNNIPSLSSASQLLNSVLAGGVYVGLDHFAKADSSSMTYKWLYLTGSSAVITFLGPGLLSRS